MLVTILLTLYKHLFLFLECVLVVKDTMIIIDTNTDNRTTEHRHRMFFLVYCKLQNIAYLLALLNTFAEGIFYVQQQEIMSLLLFGHNVNVNFFAVTLKSYPS